MAIEMDSEKELTEDELRNAFVNAAGGDSEEEADDSAAPEESSDAGQPDSEVGDSEGQPEPESADQGEPEGHRSVSFESLLSTAKEYGIPTDGIRSEAELSERVLSQVRRMQSLVLQQQMQQQQRPPEQPRAPEQPQEQWTPQTHFQTKYGGPEWKDTYTQAINSGLVQRDLDTGLFAPASGFEMAAGSVVAEMNAAQQHAAQFWQGLTRGNPFEQIYSALSEPIERTIAERVEQALSQRMEQTSQKSEVERFAQTNAQWLYRVDPDTGSQVLTPEGERFAQVVDDLRESGIKDPSKLLQYATQMTGLSNQPAQSPAAPAQAPPSTAPPAQRSATGAVKTQEAQQQTFLESAQRRAQHSPSARGRASEDAPQVFDQGDLESLFVRAYREQSAN